MSCNCVDVISCFLFVLYDPEQDIDNINTKCKKYINDNAESIVNIEVSELKDNRSHERYIEESFLAFLGKNSQLVQTRAPYINTVKNAFNAGIDENEQLELEFKESFSSFIDFIADELSRLEFHYETYRSAMLENISVSKTAFEGLSKKIEENKEEQKQLLKAYKTQKKELKKSKRQLNEARDTVDNLLPNLLTVLSIFVSIIIAVLVVYVTLFLQDNEYVSFVEQYIQARFAKYILGAHVAGDLFFLMMFVVARLTNRTILIKCSDFEWRHDIEDKDKDTYTTNFHYSACADCRYKCSNIKKLKNKSAYIIYYNILMFVLYGILYYWWILDYYAKG